MPSKPKLKTLSKLKKKRLKLENLKGHPKEQVPSNAVQEELRPVLPSFFVESVDQLSENPKCTISPQSVEIIHVEEPGPSHAILGELRRVSPNFFVEPFDLSSNSPKCPRDTCCSPQSVEIIHVEEPGPSHAILEELQRVSPNFFVEPFDLSPNSPKCPRDTCCSPQSVEIIHVEEPEPSHAILEELQRVSPNVRVEPFDLSPNSPKCPRDICSPNSIHSISQEDQPWLVEPECKQQSNKKDISGRRIVDILFLFRQLQDVTSHESLFQCKFSDLVLQTEKRVGLMSHFNFQCQLCKKTFVVKSDDANDDQNVGVNTAAVSGIVASGIGYSQFEEIFGAMDIPIFGEKYYAKIQNRIFDEWEATAVDVMERAAARECEAAKQEGRFFNGVPVIDVYADAAWCKRSFGNNYKALSGVAAIVGRRFGEVLYIGVKNKYCLICARAKKRSEEPKNHKCYKNYEGASSGMEAMVVSEGFKESINMYGLIYGSLVADGDSSTYSKILSSDPYPGLVVTKIECRNHVLRNMCNKLRTLGKDTKYPKKQRDLITDAKVMSMRKVVTTSIRETKELPRETGSNQLYVNITNAINHAYGDHRQCKDYYCNKNKDILAKTVAENEHSPFWFRLKVILSTVAAKSRSLMEDVDTNSVERFNSIVAKFVGGKRINFASKRSYQSRCSAAVVSFNTRTPIYTLHKKILGKSPKSRVKKLELKRIEKRKLANVVQRKKNRSKNFGKQNDYGSGAAAPDMSENDFRKASADFMKNLETMVSDRKGVQERTMRQRESTEWLQIRKLMITASNFGATIKRKKNFANLVNSIIYKTNISFVASVAHGLKNEKFALEQLSSQENLQIQDCGLFVDEEFPFVGATPDGVVGEDTIVEVKCPVAAFKNGIENAIRQNKVQILKYNKKTNQVSINKNSNWYYQVQGQLRVTGKQRCVFGIWGKETEKMEVLYIQKDDGFWKDKMETKLVSFYHTHILPELVDSRRARGMPLRGSEK